MKRRSAPMYPKLDIYPYMAIIERAIDRGVVTTIDAAELLGVSRTAAWIRMRRMVFTGALIPTGENPVRYHPGRVAGCQRILQIATEKSIKWLDYQAMTSPAGGGT